jgi:hypothetical protein
MKDHWESIKKSILLDTPGSMLGQRFVFADIVEPMQISDNEGNIRELRYICNACYQKVNSGQKINCMHLIR